MRPLEDWQKNLHVRFRARIPLVHLQTFDEETVVDELKALGESKHWKRNDGIYLWDHADQFRVLKEGEPRFPVERNATVDTALTMIDEFDGDGTFVLLDFHHAWVTRRSVTRKLRNLASKSQRARNKNVIIVTVPGIEIPVELEHDMYSLEFPRPGVEQVEVLLDSSLTPS